MTRLIVWRHGQTDWNASGRVQGSLDVDLNQIGEVQTAAVAAQLSDRRPTAIYSSDLRRAARAAQALSALVGLPVEYDVRLRERDYGPWEGLERHEVEARFPEDFARWVTNQPVQTPGIEAMADLGKRMAAVLQEVAERNPDGTVVIATHGAVARAGCGELLGWPMSAWTTMTVLNNCHTTELVLSDHRGWQLDAHNAS